MALESKQGREMDDEERNNCNTRAPLLNNCDSNGKQQHDGEHGLYMDWMDRCRDVVWAYGEINKL